MSSRGPFRFGPVGFVLSLIGLAVLPLAPEIILYLRNHGDLKYFVPVWYYECIVVFLLWVPVLLLGRFWSRAWAVAVGILTFLVTLPIGFHAISPGARWDTTAQTALLQTNPA